MAINTEKNTYTVLFAVIMVVVVGSILAFLASGLRSRIDENERFEKQQNILYAMGVHENTPESGVNFIPTTVVEEQFNKYVKQRYVLVNGELQKDDEAFLVDMKKQLSILKNGGEARLPIFIGEKDGTESYILPMHGKGLWDAIWGYIAVDKDMVVQGVYFDHKAETPGLGANIKMRFFKAIFDNSKVN